MARFESLNVILMLGGQIDIIPSIQQFRLPDGIDLECLRPPVMPDGARGQIHVEGTCDPIQRALVHPCRQKPVVHGV